MAHDISCVFSHILRTFSLFGKGGNLTVHIFYLHFRYSHSHILFYRPKSCRLVPTRFTIVPAGLGNTVLVRSDGYWSSVYEKQTRLPAQWNHLFIQRYANGPELSPVFKSKYTKLQIYLLTAIGLIPGDSSTVHIYTQTIPRTTQLIREECGPCPVFASYTLASAIQLRKKHGKTLVRAAEECQVAR